MQKKYYMREDFDGGSTRPPRKTGIIFASIFFVIIIIIGLYVLGASSKKSSSPIVPTVLATPTVIPVVTRDTTPVSPTGSKTSPTPPKTSPTKSAGLDRSELEVAVLNGSGVAGAAKNISTYLTELGYDVTTTGNADAFDYKNLTILITKEKSSYLTMLKKDLSTKSASISSRVDDTIDTDAEVIIGK